VPGATVAAVDPWRFQAHPEVWALVAGLAGLWWYAVRRIGPTAVRGDERVVTRGQVGWFAAALLTLWLASDWPMHDLAEERLYAVHMLQHLLISFIVPAMALLATPTWLARLVVGSGRGYRVVRTMSRLVPASLLFNAIVLVTHAPATVHASVSNAGVHYLLHLLVFFSGLIMWLGVCGPLPELRFRMPVQMAHLFLQSIIPVVPAGWLTFAESVIYKDYDTPYRMFGLSAVDDQQLAGVVMKVGGSTFLWTVIIILFARWVERSEGDERARGIRPDRRAPEADLLTWADVEHELATAPPAPHEPEHT
jgi:putative membrane protein